MRPSPVVLVLFLALVAAGCGAGRSDTIRIGIYGDCYGWDIPNHTAQAAGADLAFVERGAKQLGPTPLDGVGAVTVGGKRVELVDGCDFYGSDVSELAAARRLVEQQHVDILVPPQVVPEITEVTYPPQRPGIAFVSTGLLPVPGRPNLFRVVPDFRQASAGLGVYAYKTLGWRRAAVVGEDDYVGWSLAAGFIAEFCSLGGTIADRLWEEPDAKSWAPSVEGLPAGVDGVAFMPNFLRTTSFFDAYRKLQPDLRRHVVMSAVAIAKGDRTPGIMTTGFLPFASAASAWTRYRRSFRAAFPSFRGQVGSAGDLYTYDAVKLALQAIAYAHGDLSHGERRLMDAMHRVKVATPVGTLRLDGDNEAIAPNFYIRVEPRHGKLVPVTVGVIPDVEKSFGGYFTPSSPPDDGTHPICRKGHVPPWAS
jgi:branched-chain amino acid transport system substrate-binding protein